MHPADLREALHLMAENEPQTGPDTGHQTDARDEEDARDGEQDPDAA